jgi:hypothetical protein
MQLEGSSDYRHDGGRSSLRCCMLILVLNVGGLVGCAATASRPESSGYACMVAVRNTIPADISDQRKHCLAAGGIARQCGAMDARMASIGKEVQDAFSAGDASWSDWRADRAGMRCAKHAASGEDLAVCCAQAGYP